MTTVLDTLKKGTAYLEKKGVDSPRLTMELLAAHVLKLQRMELYLEFDRPLLEPELEKLRELIKKRGERIPLQHILGTVEFYGREFICDERALIPRPETEELIAYTLKLALPSPLEILDLCSGSGIIGLTLKAELGEDAQVTLADISPTTLSLARENAQKLELEVELLHSDAFDGIEGVYDLIICNPPYVSTDMELEAELCYDPDLALFSGEDGLDLLRSIIPEAKSFLKDGGALALEIGYDQSAKVQTLLEQEGYKNIQVLEDMEKILRFPIAWKS